jgi:hypothetical protein
VNARRVSTRRSDARRFREEAAALAAARTHPDQVSNGEESEYVRPNGQLSYVANYSKALPHNQFGEVNPAAYRSLLRALYSHNPDHFEQIPLGMPNTGLNLTNPQAGLASIWKGLTPKQWPSLPRHGSTAPRIPARWWSCTGWRCCATYISATTPATPPLPTPSRISTTSRISAAPRSRVRSLHRPCSAVSRPATPQARMSRSSCS